MRTTRGLSRNSARWLAGDESRLGYILDSLKLKPELCKKIEKIQAYDFGNDAGGLIANRNRMYEKFNDTYKQLARQCGLSERRVRETADIIMPLLDIAERCGYTIYGHQYRTMDYGQLMIGYVDEAERAHVNLGLLIHDIGKCAIDPKLLRRRGKLPDKTKKRINKHVEYSGEILSRVLGELPLVVDIARYHHEQFGGGGYPSGRPASQMHIGIRIANLADSIDAMASERIYHTGPPANIATIVERLKAMINTQFNGELATFIVTGIYQSREFVGRLSEIIESGGGTP